MNNKLLKALIREKEALESGREAPARVTEVKFDGAGNARHVACDAAEWQRAQAATHAERAAEARRKLKLTQEEFSILLGVSRRTLESWEQGVRVPTGAARVLLAVAERHPRVVLEAAWA